VLAHIIPVVKVLVAGLWSWPTRLLLDWAYKLFYLIFSANKNPGINQLQASRKSHPQMIPLNRLELFFFKRKIPSISDVGPIRKNQFAFKFYSA
jgi:hypothetical protein